MRQQLEGKSTTKPAYTLDRKVKWPVRLSVRSSGFHPGKRGSIPLRATNGFIMKKVVFLLLIAITMSSCVWVPIGMSPYQRRLWEHQNTPRQYYYKKYPSYKERVKPGRIYRPYFRNGRF